MAQEMASQRRSFRQSDLVENKTSSPVTPQATAEVVIFAEGGEDSKKQSRHKPAQTFFTIARQDGS